MSHIRFALPSKGRIQEEMNKFFSSAGIKITKSGGQRTYIGGFKNYSDIEITFLSASEIAKELHKGNVHLGLTGLDLINELDSKKTNKVVSLLELGFSKANVVAAIPNSWIDVSNTKDLAEVSKDFIKLHDRRLRVATKFENLTRNFFLKNNINSYRIVESTGATEGAPSAGTAEMITDITESGVTLEENNLKVLDDGIILKSEACIFGSFGMNWENVDLENIKKLLRILSAKSNAISHTEITFNYDQRINNLDIELYRNFKSFFLNQSFTLGNDVSLITPNDQVAVCSEFLISKGYGTIKINKPDFIYKSNDESWEKLLSNL